MVSSNQSVINTVDTTAPGRLVAPWTFCLISDKHFLTSENSGTCSINLHLQLPLVTKGVTKQDWNHS